MVGNSLRKRGKLNGLEFDSSTLRRSVMKEIYIIDIGKYDSKTAMLIVEAYWWLWKARKAYKVD